MLAELVHHVVGVDPDRDWITLAVVDARSAGVIAEGRFAATGDGYEEAVDFVDVHSGAPVLTSERQRSIRDRYTVTVQDPRLDFRVAASMAVALDALQSR